MSIMSDPFSTPTRRRALTPAEEAAAVRRAAPAAQRAEQAPSKPAAAAAPAPAPQPEPAPAPALPPDFVFEAEHPVVPVPFRAQIGNATWWATRFRSRRPMSRLTACLTRRGRATGGDPPPVRFPGFSVLLCPEVVVAGQRREGEMTLQFMDPAGAHLPQLRYILNTALAGDFVSMGGMLSYTGPTQPKAAKAADTPNAGKLRLRSAAVAFMSFALMLAAGGLMLSRAMQLEELRPVFIERAGKEMKATTAGQISYLNPEAKKGEVVFSINANSGDVLNFQLPCDCEISVTEGIFEGSTVLPFDAVLSFFDPGVGCQRDHTNEHAGADEGDGRGTGLS